MAVGALTARQRREAVESAGRVGLAARGSTYVVVGMLSLLVAFHHPASAPSREGALEAVARQPFGRVLVTLLALGFAASAIWRAGEAVVGDKLAKRAGDAARAVLYFGFFLAAFPFIVRGHDDAGSRREVDVTARVLGWPGGRWLVLAIGVAIIAGGVWNGYRGLAQRYRKKLKWREMPTRLERIIPLVATAGYIGRMCSFALVGGFVVRAAWQHAPDDAGGLDVALYRVMERPHGSAVVAAVGAGLVLFGIYSYIEARYRKIPA
jgi:hypothetical protein